MHFRLLFLKRISRFLEPVIFPLFRSDPYTRMCVSTLGSSSTFGKQMNNHSKSQVESWFWGFSVVFVFSVYLSKLSLVTFPPRGPHGGCDGGPRRCGRPRPMGGRPGPHGGGGGPHGAGTPGPSLGGRPRAPRRTAPGPCPQMLPLRGYEPSANWAMSVFQRGTLPYR